MKASTDELNASHARRTALLVAGIYRRLLAHRRLLAQRAAACTPRVPPGPRLSPKNTLWLTSFDTTRIWRCEGTDVATVISIPPTQAVRPGLMLGENMTQSTTYTYAGGTAFFVVFS